MDPGSTGWINSFAPGRCGLSLKSEIFKPVSRIDILSIFYGITLSECHKASLMISQHWFKWWLVAVRQQAITWANVNPDLWCHMAPLGHNGLLRIVRILRWIASHMEYDKGQFHGLMQGRCNSSALAKDLHISCIKPIDLVSGHWSDSWVIIIEGYNMTVWILAGNYISFTIAAGLIRLHMPGVKKSRV